MKRPIPISVLACTWALALFVTLMMAAFARAQDPVTPKAQYVTDGKAAQKQYESDTKLCNDEGTPAGRLQCRRDARVQYDQALSAAKAKMAATTASTSPG